MCGKPCNVELMHLNCTRVPLLLHSLVLVLVPPQSLGSHLGSHPQNPEGHYLIPHQPHLHPLSHRPHSAIKNHLGGCRQLQHASGLQIVTTFKSRHEEECAQCQTAPASLKPPSRLNFLFKLGNFDRMKKSSRFVLDFHSIPSSLNARQARPSAHVGLGDTIG